MERSEIFRYLSEEYGIVPEYPFDEGITAVLRHPNSGKWFGVIMNISRARLGLPGDGMTDLLDVHCPGFLSGSAPGYVPAYHMNKKSWLGLVLSDVETPEEVFLLLDDSYRSVSPLRKAAKKDSAD